jgi:hypothetical protein
VHVRKAHTGFEPVLPEGAAQASEDREPAEASAPDLPEELQRVVERITRETRAGRHEP